MGWPDAGIYPGPLSDDREFEGRVSAGAAEGDELRDVLGHLIIEWAGDIDDDPGVMSRGFVNRKVTFPAEADERLEIYPLH